MTQSKISNESLADTWSYLGKILPSFHCHCWLKFPSLMVMTINPSIHWDHTLYRASVLPKQSPGLLGAILDRSPLRHRSLNGSIIPASWCSFCQPRKDDRLSQPHLVLIQRSSRILTRDPRIQSPRP